MKKIVLVLLIILGSFSLAAADTIYLRGGTTLQGRVLGFINGRFAVEVSRDATISIAGGNNRTQTNSSGATRTIRAGEVIFLRPRDIDRVEIDGRSIDDARYQTRTVDVTLSSNWIDSGVDVRRNERLRVDATGTIYAGRSRITPAGLSTTDPNAPLPRAAEGELIGVIGNDYNSPIVEIGASRELVADRDGRLYLTVNRGSYVDARGAFNTRIRKEIDLTAMTRADDSRNQDDNNDPFGYPTDNGNSPAPTRSRTGGSTGGGGSGRRNNRTLERTIDVPGNQSRGVATGIDLRSGDQITITASGNVTAGRRAGVVSPEGGRVGAGAVFGATQYPVPTAGVGALVGYILQANGQASQFFLVGPQATLTVPADGRLYLMVNDDNYSDNSGSFSAVITYPDYR
ncbi:MAG TPA: LecA/PA-IL family lectin [Pyrinomonadaceae bacterium]|nr:LecA/PA-IL family lectin [Pyrinomonadaceae bacterium]